MDRVLQNVKREKEAQQAPATDSNVRGQLPEARSLLGDIYHAGTGLERQYVAMEKARKKREAAERRLRKERFKGSITDKAYASITAAFHPHPLVLKHEGDGHAASCTSCLRALESREARYVCEQVAMERLERSEISTPCGYCLCEECYAVAYMEAYRNSRDPPPPPPQTPKPKSVSEKLSGAPPWMLDPRAYQMSQEYRGARRSAGQG